MNEKTKKRIADVLKWLMIGCAVISVVAFCFADEVMASLFFLLAGAFGLAFLTVGFSFGLFKLKAGEIQKYAISVNGYEQFVDEFEKSMSENNYTKQVSLPIDDQGSLVLFAKHGGPLVLDCYTVLRVPEFTEKMYEQFEQTFGAALEKYYGTSYVTDAINVTMICCVDRVTADFTDLIATGPQAMHKKFLVPVGVVLEEKSIYIAEKYSGPGEVAFKKRKKKCIELLHAEEVPPIEE